MLQRLVELAVYTSRKFVNLCKEAGVRQSLGAVGSCFDNAVAEAFFSSLEWEVLSRHDFTAAEEAKEVILEWCLEFYNFERRHSSAAMLPPAVFERQAFERGSGKAGE